MSRILLSVLPPHHVDTIPTDDDAADHGHHDHYLMGNSPRSVNFVKIERLFFVRDPGIIMDGTNKTKTQAAAHPTNILKSAVCLKSTIKLLFLYFDELNDWEQTRLNHLI